MSWIYDAAVRDVGFAMDEIREALLYGAEKYEVDGIIGVRIGDTCAYRFKYKNPNDPLYALPIFLPKCRDFFLKAHGVDPRSFMGTP